jgi:hypothetical protein
MWPNQVIIADVPTLKFVFWPKPTLPKVLYWKMYCHEAKSTCAAKDLVFLDECAPANISEFEN